MRGTIEVSHMLDHRLAQVFAVPTHGAEPGMRQAHHDEIEIAGLRPLAVHHVEAIAPLAGLADLEDAMIELNVGRHFRPQAGDQLLIAVLDRIEADIALNIHHEVLQRVEAVGVMRLGGEIRSRHRLEEALGGGIADFAVEHFLRRHPRPGVLVIVGADAFVIFQRRDHLRAFLAESLDRRRGLGAVFLAHARHVVEQHAIEHHLLGVHGNGLQTEVLDQFAQRVRTDHRVIIDLGHAGFIGRRRRIELARDDLAAETVRSLIEGDTAEVAELSLEIPGTHQAARAATDNRKIKHLDTFAP